MPSSPDGPAADVPLVGCQRASPAPRWYLYHAFPHKQGHPYNALVRNGIEAVEMTDRHYYDLVILDWWIPPPTGIKLLRSWRASDAVGRVLMLTGSHADAERDEAMEAGADDFLEKPFSLTLLRGRAQRLLNTVGSED